MFQLMFLLLIRRAKPIVLLKAAKSSIQCGLCWDRSVDCRFPWVIHEFALWYLLGGCCLKLNHLHGLNFVLLKCVWRSFLLL